MGHGQCQSIVFTGPWAIALCQLTNYIFSEGITTVHHFASRTALYKSDQQQLPTVGISNEERLLTGAELALSSTVVLRPGGVFGTHVGFVLIAVGQFVLARVLHGGYRGKKHKGLWDSLGLAAPVCLPSCL